MKKNKAMILKITAGLFLLVLVLSIVNQVKSGKIELPTLYREDPIALGTYTTGKIELNEEFSRKFTLNPSIGQNMQFRLMEGSVDGELLVNEGRPEERVVKVRFSANPMAEKVEIGGIVTPLRFRITDLTHCLSVYQRQLTYVIYLTDKPRSDWYVEAGNAALEK